MHLIIGLTVYMNKPYFSTSKIANRPCQAPLMFVFTFAMELLLQSCSNIEPNHQKQKMLPLIALGFSIPVEVSPIGCDWEKIDAVIKNC